MNKSGTDQLGTSKAARQIQHWQAFIQLALEGGSPTAAAQMVLGRLLERTQLAHANLTLTNRKTPVLLAAVAKWAGPQEALISQSILLETKDGEALGKLEVYQPGSRDFDPQDLAIAQKAAEALALTLPVLIKITSLEKGLQSSNAKVQAINDELESFANSVSHDLRAPLRGIDGYSQALMEDYGKNLDDLARAYLQYIRDAAHLMANLIDRMLKLSRIIRTEIQPADVNLSTIAAEITARLKKAYPDRQVETTIAPDLEVKADPGLMHILMQILLENAWKFTSKHPTAQIEVGAYEADDNQVFFVRDDGAGFNPAYKSRLFQPFQRLHGAQEFEGAGIGLATAQRIIRRHQGEIWAEGAPERGATFYFTL